MSGESRSLCLIPLEKKKKKKAGVLLVRTEILSDLKVLEKAKHIAIFLESKALINNLWSKESKAFSSLMST